MPSRRRVLAGTGLFLTTGCLWSDPESAPADASSGTATASSDGTPECQRGLVLAVDDFAPTEQLLAPLSPPERDVVGAAVEDGETTVQTYYQAPVRDGVHVAYEGAYYRTVVAEADTIEVPALELDVSWEQGQQAPDDQRVLTYATLPEPDRRALAVAIYGSRHESDVHPTEGLHRRSTPAPYPGGTDGSTFETGDAVWLEWDDRAYELSIRGETSVTRRTVDYRVTEVAASDDGFREYVADRYLITLDDLDDGASSVLETAIEDDYRECEPASAAFADLRDRLVDDRGLPDPNDGEWYVRYDGRRYRLRIFGWVV